MKKTVQYFSEEYLKWCKTIPLEQALQFVEDFRNLHAEASLSQSKSKLISLKIPEDLLKVFKICAEQKGISYQSQIKNLMKSWVMNQED